jgi:lactoylglutathione lyase
VSTSLSYVIKFVANMDDAIRFHEADLGLKLRFRSPEWTEFETGGTTLALHAASEANPAGKCQVGFRVDDIAAFHAELSARGVKFTMPPTDLHGHTLARFLDADGAECSVSGA